MTADEANVWRMYFAKHGFSQNNTHTDLILANIGHLIAVGAGIKNPKTGAPFGADHFVPWLVPPEEPEEVTGKMSDLITLFPTRKPH